MPAIEQPIGDLEPPLRLTLRQAAAPQTAGASRDGEGRWHKSVSIVNAERVVAFVESLDTNAELLERDFVVEDAEAGAIALFFLDSDYDVLTRGNAYRLLVRVFWPGARPETWPTSRADAWTIRIV